MSTRREEIDRTEAPSPRWVAHARAVGPRPSSRLLVTACTVLAGVLTVRCAGPSLVRGLESMLERALQGAAGRDSLPDRATFGQWLSLPCYNILPFVVVPSAVAAVVGMAQGGFRFRPDRLCPSLERFAGGSGLRQIMHGASLKGSLMAAVQWSGLLAFAIWWLWSELFQAGSRPMGPTSSALNSNAMVLLRVTTKLAFLLVAIGLADYARAWFAHLAEMRLSRAELIADLRETEGDPIIRRRRRQIRIARMFTKWETLLRPGDLLLLGNGRLAVALRPAEAKRVTLLANAVGAIADTLHRAARNRGARVLRQDALARNISKRCQPGQALPEDLARQVDWTQSMRFCTVRTRLPLPSQG